MYNILDSILQFSIILISCFRLCLSQMSSLPGVGVFGSNTTARWMVRKLQDQGFRVEAIWCRVFSEAETVATSLSIPFFTSRVDDVLLRKDVGLVVILCPPNLHSQIAVKALGIGKHVLCGIPGSLSQAEFLRMVQVRHLVDILTSYQLPTFRLVNTIHH